MKTGVGVTDLHVLKVPGGTLIPSLDNDAEIIAKWPTFEPLKVKITRPRNGRHLRKYMALMQFAFQQWEPEPDGPAVKDFDNFRADVLIEMGYCRYVFTIEGGVVKQAKSISFANMDQDEFNRLYSDTITYLVGKFLNGYTKQDLEQVVDQILGFV